MPTLTANDTFSIGDATTQQESVDITIIPAPSYASGTGTGRITHPTLGTYDYPSMPNEWGGFDEDVVQAPIWAHTRTISSGANTLWAGNFQDRELYERWTSSAAMSAEQFRMLLSMFLNPPTPPSYIVWEPSYINDKSFNVILHDLSAGPRGGQNFNHIMRQQTPYIHGPVQLTLRVIGYS